MSNASESAGVKNFLCNNATAAQVGKLSTDISCDDFITIMAVTFREKLDHMIQIARKDSDFATICNEAGKFTQFHTPFPLRLTAFARNLPFLAFDSRF